MNRAIVAFLTMLMMLAIPTAVSAHSVTEVKGTVDCDGNYSITATGDVFGGVHLIVTLSGTTIYDQPQNGSDQSQTFGPFTGTGAHEGDAITARPGDTDTTATGTLVLIGGPCDHPCEDCVVTPTAAATASCVDRDGDGRRESAKIHLAWDTDGADLLLHLRARFGSVLRAPADVTVNGTGARNFYLPIGHRATHIHGLVRIGTVQRVVDRTIACQAEVTDILLGHIQGPCGDPWFRAVMDTRDSIEGGLFKFSYVDFVTGQRVVSERLIGPGRLVKGSWKHVVGGTTMVLRAGGETLDRQVADPAGTYAPCRTMLAGTMTHAPAAGIR